MLFYNQQELSTTKINTYADDDWLPLIWLPFIWCGAFKSGDEGAETSELSPRESSTSDTDPFLFFFERENALLKELRSWKDGCL